MIKLNIQLFGGDSAADRRERADSDGDGFVTIPALNGETYKVPDRKSTRLNSSH